MGRNHAVHETHGGCLETMKKEDTSVLIHSGLVQNSKAERGGEWHALTR